MGGSPWAFGAFVDFTLTGASGALPGQAATITLTPVAVTTDTITFATSGLSGTFSPTSLTWSNSSAAKSVTFTPSAAGSGTITATSADGAPITGSPLSFVAAAITLAPQITKWGGLVIPVNASTGEANGYFPIAPVTAVNSNPSLFMNGNQVTLNGPAWGDQPDQNLGPPALDSALLMYYAQCGTVASIGMTTCGKNYTAASAAWTSGSGGGSSLELGTPVLGQGVTSYTISSAGSGQTNGAYQFTIPGGTFVSPATALVTVSGGAVTAVVPACGSWIGMGSGYTGTSFTFSYGNATITANISGYVQSVPVTSSSDDFTSLPTITITGNGTGATTAPFMSGPPAGAAMTMSLAQGAINGNGGTSIAYSGSIPNYAGQLEPYFANVTPSIPYGGELGTTMFTQSGPLFLAKNKLLSGFGWGAGVATDANGFPVSGTPGTTVIQHVLFRRQHLHLPGTGEPGRSSSTTQKQATVGPRSPRLSARKRDVIGSPVRSVSGSLVTITQTIELPANPTTNFFSLAFEFTWPTSGTWNITNIRILAPGNTDTYATNPLDLDDNVVAALTGPGGTTPGVLSGGWIAILWDDSGVI